MSGYTMGTGRTAAPTRLFLFRNKSSKKFIKSSSTVQHRAPSALLKLVSSGFYPSRLTLTIL